MTYPRMVQRATAIACFLGPALLILGSALYTTRPSGGGIFAGSELFNDPINKLEWVLCSYFGSLLILPAYFRLVAMVGERMPRLAMTAAPMGLLGIASLISGHNYEVSLATVDRAGIDVSWLTLIAPSGPSAAQLLVGLPIVLYFLSLLLLGYGVLRSGALPRWAGVPLIAAGLLQFDSAGPQPSGLPLLTWLLAVLCLALVYALVGARLWRGESAPAMAGREARTLA